MRRLLRREDHAPRPMMLAIASLIFGALGLFLASEWSVIAESIRIGTTHLSNRALHLPVTQNPAWTCGIAVTLFWVVAVGSMRAKAIRHEET